MFVRANGALHHVEVAGPADAPVIVFANSLGSDLHIWNHTIDQIGIPVRAVRYDMRGHGLTASPPLPYSIPHLARDLALILDALRVRRAIVCGVSVGGMVAMRLATERPEMVEGLVLCDTGYRIGTIDTWNQRIAAVEAEGVGGIADSIMTRWFTSDFRRCCADQVEGYRYMLQRSTVAGYTGICAAIRDADLEADARSLRCPTMVLCGDQDVATPPELNRALATAIPNAQLAIVEGAGHLPCIEQPAAVGAHLRAFVRSLTYV